MSNGNKHKLNRREFLKQTTAASAALAGGLSAKPTLAAKKKPSKAGGKKVIVIGVDGMDPSLSEKMMKTEKQCAPFLSMTETIPGVGYWEIGDHKIQMPYWPFNHKPAETLLRRQGVPFWDYLDKAGIYSTFYDLPSNYPPSSSKYGYHRCLSGMGTPDMRGGHGGYYHFAEDGPFQMKDESGCVSLMLFFENETAGARLVGPANTLLKEPEAVTIDFLVHRDIKAQAAVIEIQKHKIPLKQGQWSNWIKLDFELDILGPNKHISGICRFYLQEVTPNFRLYVSPINNDPSNSYLQITEPPEFIGEISNSLGLFYTTGFQEDHKALSNGVFNEDEFVTQAGIVLEERFNLLNYAMDNYEDGLLYFYFSSTDIQAHMLWWDTDEPHPTRSAAQARKYFGHLKDIYRKMDDVLGDILKRYGDEATIIMMSDHGFANFKRQFNLNTWLRENGYLGPANSTSVLYDVDWSETRAYGLGINGLYINTKGRERDGIVDPGQQREELIAELIQKLEAIIDSNGKRVIRKVHRSDRVYRGSATRLAPDLIVGYSRDYRASWSTCLGDMNEDVLSDNDSAWAADHCADVSEVPGVVFSNRPIKADSPALIDIAPTILTEFGLEIPSSMEGKNIF